MSNKMQIVFPEVSDDAISSGLRELTEILDRAHVEISGGMLGGEYGYGGEYECDVFEMHPYWWGDCGCGHEDRAVEWEKSHPHGSSCYQTALSARGYNGAAELAVEWGLPQFGCAVHCTCGQHELWLEWIEHHDHDPKCEVVRPNFRHHATGFEVRWYKYIGRSMEHSGEITGRQWQAILSECIEAVAA